MLSFTVITLSTHFSTHLNNFKIEIKFVSNMCKLFVNYFQLKIKRIIKGYPSFRSDKTLQQKTGFYFKFRVNVKN